MNKNIFHTSLFYKYIYENARFNTLYKGMKRIHQEIQRAMFKFLHNDDNNKADSVTSLA